MGVKIHKDHPVESTNRELDLGIDSASIDAHFKEDLNRANEFKALADSLHAILPEDERDEFAIDPINFKSKSLLFRGLTKSKIDQLKIDGEFKPQDGDLAAGRGVFLSDSPLSAFQYQKNEAIAVFRRADLALSNDSIVKAGSAQYRKRIQDLLEGLSPEDRRTRVYTVDETMDLSYTPKEGATGNNVSLRRPQPFSAVKTLLTYSDGRFEPRAIEDILGA